MFRKKQKSDVLRRLSIGIIAHLLAVLAIALLALLLLHIRHEGMIIQKATSISEGVIQARLLRGALAETRREIIIATITLFALGGVAIVSVMVYRQYRLSQLGLDNVRTFARDVLESMPSAIITLDSEGRITSLNARATELLGCNYDATGKSYLDVVRADSALESAMKEGLSKRKVTRNYDISLDADPLASGDPLQLRIDISPLKSAAKRSEGTGGIVVHIKDVTELKQMEQQVRQSERLAGLGSLAAGVAHEIKNPLSALGIYLQLLDRCSSRDSSSARSREYIEVIKAEFHRLSGIVENFTRFARRGALEKKEADVGKIIDHVLLLIRPECSSQRIRIVRDDTGESSGDALPTIHADSDQLQQAFLNIVINAIQVMPDGGALKISCAQAQSGDSVVVRISDSGPGVRKEDVDKLFDLFFTTKKDGTGLGLPIAQKIIVEHDGYIGVETSPRGTTFSVTIPVSGSETSKNGTEDKEL